MLNQLKNNILNNNRKVIRREVRRGVEQEMERQIKEATFWGRLRWLFGKGALKDVVEESLAEEGICAEGN